MRRRGPLNEMFSRLVFLVLLLPAAAQEIGVDLCACQPAVYSIRLQLNLTCADATITPDLPGIRDITCIVDKSTDEIVTDFQPTIINEIQFLEIDQAGDIVRQNLFEGGYVDGDIIEYSSFILADASEINVMNLPSALSVFLTAQNAAGQPIINTWAIEFNNDCSVHPVLTVGQRIGWTVFTELEEPPVEPLLCPLVSAMPSEMPTTVPTFAPNLERTAAPVIATLVPADPTLSPIAERTSAPVVAAVPTVVPVDPTLSPIEERTSAPVVAPVVPADPTLSPVEERTSAPVVAPVPTAVPVDPTLSPIEERTSAPAVAPVSTVVPADPTLSPVEERTSAPVVAPVPTLVPVDPTLSPIEQKTAPPSCELHGKRKSNYISLSAPASPVKVNDKSSKKASAGTNKSKASNSSSGKKRGPGKTKDDSSSRSKERRLGVGPHAPYAYPSHCPEPLS